jgi:flagellar motor protein MotB
MRACATAGWLLIGLGPALVGCAQNPYVLQGKLQTLEQDHQALTARYQELQSRMATLDQDNQEQGTLLAQSLQQRRVLEDQLTALRDQLGGATDQLVKLRDAHQAVEKKAETLAASVKKRVGASISANSSLREKAAPLNLPGLSSRVDGDVVRIELPASQIFTPGTARLLPTASAMIDSVSAAIARQYPDQIIGVEGHTDTEPVQNNLWHNNHHLSIGRAMAVYDYLLGRGQVRPAQLFVVGHGENHPVVSNATAAGKERNRRVEIVVYPERIVGK